MDLLPSIALGNLVDTAISDWIGPLFVAAIAVVAVVLLWQRKLAGFITFAAIAVIAALFIFFGGDLFGKNGNLSQAGKDVAKKINAIDLTTTTYAPGFLTR